LPRARPAKSRSAGRGSYRQECRRVSPAEFRLCAALQIRATRILQRLDVAFKARLLGPRLACRTDGSWPYVAERRSFGAANGGHETAGGGQVAGDSRGAGRDAGAEIPSRTMRRKVGPPPPDALKGPNLDIPWTHPNHPRRAQRRFGSARRRAFDWRLI